MTFLLQLARNFRFDMLNEREMQLIISVESRPEKNVTDCSPVHQKDSAIISGPMLDFQ